MKPCHPWMKNYNAFLVTLLFLDEQSSFEYYTSTLKTSFLCLVTKDWTLVDEGHAISKVDQCRGSPSGIQSNTHHCPAPGRCQVGPIHWEYDSWKVLVTWWLATWHLFPPLDWHVAVPVQPAGVPNHMPLRVSHALHTAQWFALDLIIFFICFSPPPNI